MLNPRVTWDFQDNMWYLDCDDEENKLLGKNCYKKFDLIWEVKMLDSR